MFRNEAHTEHMRTGCTNVHGKEIVNRLLAESSRIVFGNRGSNSLEALRGFLHGGWLTKDSGTWLDVTLDLEVSSETTECEFG